jgi:hypothetical protein
VMTMTTLDSELDGMLLHVACVLEAGGSER